MAHINDHAKKGIAVRNILFLKKTDVEYFSRYPIKFAPESMKKIGTAQYIHTSMIKACFHAKESEKT